jgi:hypothetical protein
MAHRRISFATLLPWGGFHEIYQSTQYGRFTGFGCHRPARRSVGAIDQLANAGDCVRRGADEPNQREIAPYSQEIGW